MTQGVTRAVAVDVGGTFTDVVAMKGDMIVTAKVPTDAQASDKSVLAGAAGVEAGQASVFNLASTAGLNAVITRRLPKVAFLTTYGHRDILDRGSLLRPIDAVADPAWRRRFGDAGSPLVPRYLRRGVKERMMADGSVLIPLDEAQARHELGVLKRCNVQGVAICLLHAYADDAHERRMRELVREELGEVPCSISSEVSPLAKEYYRAATTLIDVLMKVMYGEYTGRLSEGLAAIGFAGTFNYSDCRANLLPADYAMERPYQLVMGGPAGGTVSAAHFGQLIADPNLLCADVGGTSCDISVVVDGEPWSSPTFELEHDLVVNANSINIITLGAGGGSIVSVNGQGDIETGPDSAGANPGPACYGLGGDQPTVTDAAVLMGVLDPDGFLGGSKSLHVDRAQTAFEALHTSMSLAQRVQFAWGMAIHNMAEGLLNIAIRRGIDPRDFSLMAFGAAGPMMLPSILDVLPVRRVIVPPRPGLFSAIGLLSSDQVYSESRGGYMELTPENAERLDQTYAALERKLLGRTGGVPDKTRIRRSFDGRVLGQSWETPFVPVPGGKLDDQALDRMVESFHRRYELLNGNRFDGMTVEGSIYRVEISVPSEKMTYSPMRRGTGAKITRMGRLRHMYGDDAAMPEYRRDDLGGGDSLVGPAVVREDTSTTFVPLNCRLTVGDFGELVIERQAT